MQLHDLMYALYVVSMYLHNNKHAQNFLCSYLGPYHPKFYSSNYQGQKNRFFRPIFRRKIGFRWCWKRFSGGKIVCKKIGKKSGKIADFSAKNRKNPIFFRKNPIFPEIWGKLYFRSLRGEKLKNGANQSCRI